MVSDTYLFIFFEDLDFDEVVSSLDRGSSSHSFGRRRFRLHISAQQLTQFA